jgi:sulfur-carrier protein adenylyltransferase/sulfurtransferase
MKQTPPNAAARSSLLHGAANRHTSPMTPQHHSSADRPSAELIGNNPPPGNLTAEDLARYARQIVLPEIGQKGQCRLRDGAVLLVGAGGLGSPLALYLAAAGVGRIGIVEPDQIEVSNLQRQILYDTAQAGRPKHEAVRARLLALNPRIRVETFPVRLGAGNALTLLRDFDLVADGADSFSTRYVVNDACVALGKPDVQGSVLRFEGQISVFDARFGPCYRCLFPAPPAPGSIPSCADAGVLGAVPGIIGALQAAEILKLLLGVGEPLIGRLLIFDALRGEFRSLRFEKDPECPACGRDRDALAGQFGEGIEALGSGVTAGSPADLTSTGNTESPEDSVQTAPAAAAGAPFHPPTPFDPDSLEVLPEQVRVHLDHGQPLVLLDVREPAEVRICALPGMTWIPLGQLPARLFEIDRNAPVVAYCHRGERSLQAVGFLRARGIARAWSLAGGIETWARRLDLEMARY